MSASNHVREEDLRALAVEAVGFAKEIISAERGRLLEGNKPNASIIREIRGLLAQFNFEEVEEEQDDSDPLDAELPEWDEDDLQ